LRDWARKVGRYLIASVMLVGTVTAVLWMVVGPAGRAGLLVAATVTLAVQFLSFGAIAAAPLGRPRFLLAWGGGALVRLVAIAAVALVIAEVEGVDVTVALLALAGLFFALLLLEPWALREGADVSTDR
jgi:uncharacterized membrane protein